MLSITMQVQISAIIVWYFTIQAVALVGWPLAFVWMRALPSRGYAAAKALGVLLTGVLFWWGGIMHLWGNTNAATLTAMGLLLAVGLWSLRGRWHEVQEWWRQHRAFVVKTELLFLCAFVLWAAVRASQPQLETAGGEKWMEIGFLNAVLRSPDLPPHDPWLSGYIISYYYLGYLLLGLVTRLAGIPSTVAFNLGNASWFALVAVAAYGIVYDLLKGRHTTQPLFGPLLLLVTGNAEGFLEVLHARGLLWPGFWAWLDIRNINKPPEAPFSWISTRFFWWWQASRTLHDYTPWGTDQEVIDEFPAFSFLLGDMHPHLLALPFVLLAVTLALNLYRGEWGKQSGNLSLPLPGRWLPLVGYALILGALGFLNTWDFPIYWALMVGAMMLRYLNIAHKEIEKEELPSLSPLLPRSSAPLLSDAPFFRFFDVAWAVLPEAIFLVVVSVVAYFPFWWALRSQAGGILPNLLNATRVPQFAVMFAPLLVPVVGLVIRAVRQTQVAWQRVAGWTVALMGGIALMGVLLGVASGYTLVMPVLRGESVLGIPADVLSSALVQRLLNPWLALLLALGVSCGVLALFGAKREYTLESESVFPLLLVLMGLLLTLAPEFIFLRDIFTARMNTIFKFYFQAWVLWSLAGAWQLARWIELLEERWRSTQDNTGMLRLFLALGLIVIGLVYTVLAVPARAKEHGTPWTLDSAAWLATSNPQDYAAIRWLNANVAGRAVIVETPGDINRAYAYEGRVSALTGLPTVLGWSDHERQWRGSGSEQAQREQDLQALFTTTDLSLTYELLQKYDVTYIYVGPVEQTRYPAEGLAKFATLFPAVYDRDGVVIYQVTSRLKHET